MNKSEEQCVDQKNRTRVLTNFQKLLLLTKLIVEADKKLESDKQKADENR